MVVLLILRSLHSRIFDVFETITPPLPIKSNFYRCDKVFHHWPILEPLYKDYNQYGVVLIEGDEAKLYCVNGSNHYLANSAHIYRMNKHKCGGQSSVRFMHLRQNQLVEFIKQITDLMNTTWLKDSVLQISGLIIAGMAELKDLIVQSNSSTLNPKLKSILRRTLPCSKENLNMNWVISQCQDILGLCDISEETKLINVLMSKLQEDEKSMIYGFTEIKDALENQQVKKLYLHRDSKHYQDIKTLLPSSSSVACIELCLLNDVGSVWLNNFGGMFAEPWFHQPSYDFF